MKIKFQKMKYWSNVILVGAILGMSISFVRAAWIDPPSTPPNDTVVGAPITTGSQSQTKQGMIGTNNFSANSGYPSGWGGGIHTWDLWAEGTVGSKNDVVAEKSVRANDVRIEDEMVFGDGSVQITALEKNISESLCYDISSGICKDNYYMRGPNKCCPFNSKIGTAGTWFHIDSVDISKSNGNNGTGNVWSESMEKIFVPAKTVSAIKISGGSDDGGYCYAYWGSGEIHTINRASREFVSSYDDTYLTSAVYPFCDEYGCSACPEHYYESSYGVCSLDINKLISFDNFSNNGNVNVWVGNYGAAEMATIEKTGLAISAGTPITLQGRYVDGKFADSVHCEIQVQYAQ